MEPLSFGARLWLALTLPFRVLFDGVAARRITHALSGELLSLPEAKSKLKDEIQDEILARQAKIRARNLTVDELGPEDDYAPALQLLAILQREGRFIDFLQEDVSGFSDADIGAAARVVHEGCTRGLKDVLTLDAIRSEAEGASVELPAGYDASLNRVTGNVTGEPPFKGTLAHHGWRVESIRLPELTAGHDPMIIAPAEVEL